MRVIALIDQHLAGQHMIKIRLAVTDDAPLLPGIERSSGKAFRQIPHLAWIADDAVQPLERHCELIEQGTAWVAEAEPGKLVGFLSAERLGRSVHIWQMAVHADHQQQGSGRRLVETVKQWAAAAHLAPITLTTFRKIAWNEPFYRSCGFRTIGGALPGPLQHILDAEVAAGLPGTERCAMWLR